MREFLIFQPISQTVTVILKGDMVKVERYENKSLNFCLPLFMPRIEQLYPHFSHPLFSLAPKDRRVLLTSLVPEPMQRRPIFYHHVPNMANIGQGLDSIPNHVSVTCTLFKYGKDRGSSRDNM